MTFEDFQKCFYENEKHKDLIILSTEYKNQKTNMTYKCSICNYQGIIRANSLLHSNGCPECLRKAKDLKRRKTHEQFVEEMKLINSNIIFLTKYNGNHNEIMCQCKICNNIWKGNPSNLLAGHGCKKCSDKRVGEFQSIPNTTIAEEMPYAIDYFVDKNIVYKYGTFSRKETEFQCPKCGYKEKAKITNYLHRNKFCPICSDNISMPNKILRLLLEALEIDAKYEYSPQYLNKQFFDGYFEIDNQKYAVEMDGNLGHGKYKFRSKERDIEGLKRDNIKNQKCMDNNIHLIRVDCASNKSWNLRFDDVKSGILKSELSILFDLSSVNWKEIKQKICINSIIYDICKDYNEYPNVRILANKYKMNKCTISRYLKIGNEYCWCNYYPNNKTYIDSKENIIA